MNKVPGKIKISYLSVEIFEHPLNIPKHPSIENIGILYHYGILYNYKEHSHLCQDFFALFGATVMLDMSYS